METTMACLGLARSTCLAEQQTSPQQETYRIEDEGMIRAYVRDQSDAKKQSHVLGNVWKVIPIINKSLRWGTKQQQRSKQTKTVTSE